MMSGDEKDVCQDEDLSNYEQEEEVDKRKNTAHPFPSNNTSATTCNGGSAETLQAVDKETGKRGMGVGWLLSSGGGSSARLEWWSFSIGWWGGAEGESLD